MREALNRSSSERLGWGSEREESVSIRRESYEGFRFETLCEIKLVFSECDQRTQRQVQHSTRIVREHENDTADRLRPVIIVFYIALSVSGDSSIVATQTICKLLYEKVFRAKLEIFLIQSFDCRGQILQITIKRSDLSISCYYNFCAKRFFAQQFTNNFDGNFWRITRYVQCLGRW